MLPLFIVCLNVLPPGREEDDIQTHLLKVLREEQETASSRLLTWAKVSVWFHVSKGQCVSLFGEGFIFSKPLSASNAVPNKPLPVYLPRMKTFD